MDVDNVHEARRLFQTSLSTILLILNWTLTGTTRTSGTLWTEEENRHTGQVVRPNQDQTFCVPGGLVSPIIVTQIQQHHQGSVRHPLYMWAATPQVVFHTPLAIDLDGGLHPMNVYLVVITRYHGRTMMNGTTRGREKHSHRRLLLYQRNITGIGMDDLQRSNAHRRMSASSSTPRNA